MRVFNNRATWSVDPTIQKDLDMVNGLIIGFRGKKGVGKNFVAHLTESVIMENAVGVRSVQLAFADPIKRFCIDVLGLDEKQCYGEDADKNTFTKYPWSNMPLHIRETYPDKRGCMTAREVMQVFGTDFCRDCFCKDIWLDATKRRIDRLSKQGFYWFLITDVRFKNECEAIRSWGGEIWEIQGPQRGQDEAKKDSHPSEKDLEKSVIIDRIIDNRFGMTESGLRKQIVDFLGIGE